MAAEQLGSITREDGSTQVTYSGRPLYYYALDETPGDALGQGENDEWFVVSTEGEAITTPILATLEMEHDATPIPTVVVAAAPIPCPTSSAPLPMIPFPEGQELVAIEDYAIGAFYPGRFVAVVDVPLTLFMIRLNSEHLNTFSLQPFLRSTRFLAPGVLAEYNFIPDQSGDFRLLNEGHGGRGDFLVADTPEEAKQRVAELGVQVIAIIHDPQGGRIIPSRIVVQKDIPVKMFNIGFRGTERVSIDLFYCSDESNIERGRVTIFDFTPDAVGEYAIRYDEHDVIGILTVE